MANVLRMADQAAIVALWERGWSGRRIAREMGIQRETVSRYVRRARGGGRPGRAVRAGPEPAISTPGSGTGDGSSVRGQDLQLLVLLA